MNNFCKNYAVFKHADAENLSEMAEELAKTPSKDGRKSQLFNLIEPNPYEDDLCEESYDWKIEHWGTEVEAEVTDFDYDAEKDPNTLTVSFYTEWSPPIDLYEYMTSEDWSVEAMFAEPESNYVGCFKDQQGIYYDYDFSEGEKFLENIPEELIKFGELKSRYNQFLKEKEFFLDEGENEDA